MKTASIYVKHKVNSLDAVKNKIKLCQDFAQQNQLYVTHIYCDCVSNYSMRGYDLERLLRDCKEHKFECVIILSVTNPTRNFDEFQRIYATLKENNIELLTVADEKEIIKFFERMDVLQ